MDESLGMSTLVECLERWKVFSDQSGGSFIGLSFDRQSKIGVFNSFNDRITELPDIIYQ